MLPVLSLYHHHIYWRSNFCQSGCHLVGQSAVFICSLLRSFLHYWLKVRLYSAPVKKAQPSFVQSEYLSSAKPCVQWKFVLYCHCRYCVIGCRSFQTKVSWTLSTTCLTLTCTTRNCVRRWQTHCISTAFLLEPARVMFSWQKSKEFSQWMDATLCWCYANCDVYVQMLVEWC